MNVKEICKDKILKFRCTEEYKNNIDETCKKYDIKFTDLAYAAIDDYIKKLKQYDTK